MEFKFFNFKKLSQTKKKITRKRATLDLKKQEVYPAEGHASLSFVYKEKYCIVCIGGASHRHTSLWTTVNTLTIFICEKSEDDFWVESIKVIDKMEGAKLLNFSHSSLTLDKIIGNNVYFYMYGGFDLRSRAVVDSLYHFKLNMVSWKCDISLIPTEVPLHDSVSNVKVQSGDIPTGRLGHTFTQVKENTWLLVGGAGVDATEDAAVLLAAANYNVKDSFVYCLTVDDSKYLWQKRDMGNALCRAFHTATLIPSNQQIAVIGGWTQIHGDRERLPVQEIYVLSNVDAFENITIQMKLCTLQSPVKCYLSTHTAALCDDTIHVYGGFSQFESRVKMDTYPEISSEMFKINLSSQLISVHTIDKINSTAGASSHFIGSKLLLIIGGTNQSVNIYSRMIVPSDLCDLEDECIIDKTSTSEVDWIQCDLCKKWLHMYCINLASAPEHFKCRLCCPTSVDSGKASSRPRGRARGRGRGTGRGRSRNKSK